MQTFIEDETPLKEIKEIIKIYRRLPPEKKVIVFDWLMKVTNESTPSLQTSDSEIIHME